MKTWDQLEIKVWDHSLCPHPHLGGKQDPSRNIFEMVIMSFISFSHLCFPGFTDPKHPRAEWKQCKVWMGDLFHCQLSPPACGISSLRHIAAGCQKPWPLVSSSQVGVLLMSDLKPKKSCIFLFEKRPLVQFSSSCSSSFPSPSSTSMFNTP